jgi:hypothetical protein
MDAFIFNFILGIVLVGLIVLTIVRRMKPFNKRKCASCDTSPVKCPMCKSCPSCPAEKKCPVCAEKKEPKKEPKKEKKKEPKNKEPKKKGPKKEKPAPKCPVCAAPKQSPSPKCPACSVIFMSPPPAMKRPLNGMHLDSTTSPSMYQLYAYEYGTRPNY